MIWKYCTYKLAYRWFFFYIYIDKHYEIFRHNPPYIYIYYFFVYTYIYITYKKETFIEDNIIFSTIKLKCLRPTIHRWRRAQITSGAHLHGVMLLLLLLLLMEHNRFDAGRACWTFRTALLGFYGRRCQRA